jgi:hypothetical protein
VADKNNNCLMYSAAICPMDDHYLVFRVDDEYRHVTEVEDIV